MSSISSSECECEEYYTYKTSLYNQGTYARTPFYPSMGHPLIYYAQMPAPPKRQRSRENRKDNRNCFAKAFRWYTEEHVPYRSDTYNKTGMNGFAAWLDSKYDEYVQDSQFDSIYRIKMKQTSVIEAERMPHSSCCERAKRFRVKSPWKKRRASREAADINPKQNQSFQVILQPKDLSRLTSECCQSNATMVSHDIPKRPNFRSQSYTIISRPEPLADPADIGIVTAIDEDKPGKNVKEHKNHVIKELSQNKALQNVSCQCSVPKVVKINVQSQYNDTDAQKDTEICVNHNTPKLCQCCQNKSPSHTTAKRPSILSIPKSSISNISKPRASSIPKEIQIKATSHKNTFCQCSEELISKPDVQNSYYIHSVTEERGTSISDIQNSLKIPRTCPCESIIKEIGVNNYKVFSSPVLSSNTAQTSDHSIRLDKDAAHAYPLFMKIVCADRLSK